MHHVLISVSHLKYNWISCDNLHSSKSKKKKQKKLIALKSKEASSRQSKCNPDLYIWLIEKKRGNRQTFYLIIKKMNCIQEFASI